MDHHGTGPGGRRVQLRRRGIAKPGRRRDRRRGGGRAGEDKRRRGEKTQTRDPFGRRGERGGGDGGGGGGELVRGDAANRVDDPSHRVDDPSRRVDDPSRRVDVSFVSFVPFVAPALVRFRVGDRHAGSVPTGYFFPRRACDGASGGVGDDRGGDEVPSGRGVHREDPLDARRAGLNANAGGGRVLYPVGVMRATRRRDDETTRRRDDEGEGRDGRRTDRWDEGVEREATRVYGACRDDARDEI